MGTELEPSEDLDRPSESPEPAVIDRFLEQQGRELELKAQELELKKQEDNNQLEFAKLALAAQERDRNGQRQFAKSRQVHRMLFVGGVIVLLVIALLMVVNWGKDALAMALVEKIGLLGGGFIGGFGAARYKGAEQKEQPELPDPEDR